MGRVEWTVIASEEEKYDIKIDGNRVAVNGDFTNINKLPKVNAGFLVKAFELPTGSKKTVMYSPSITKGELWDVVVDGKNIADGQDYVPCKVESWAFIFPILYFMNMFFLVGGAVGGAIFGGGSMFSLMMSMQRGVPLKTRVISNIAYYAVFTLIELGLSMMFAQMM